MQDRSNFEVMELNIDGFRITNDSKTFIIAELSANHNKLKNNAIETIKAAKKAGADAIKLQTYTADTLTIDCDNEYFQIGHGTLWDGKTLYNLYEEAYTPWEWHEELFHVARNEGLICFSSPFDKSAVDFLEQYNPPAYKIASFEISDIPLIEYAASKGKPMIISTGIARLSEIAEAVDACRKVGNNNIALLKCTSAYPASPEEANLATIKNLTDTFNVISGLSDHTMGSAVSVAAVTLGAKIVEKHFILDKNIGGPDADFSMEPVSFKQMVDDIRTVEKSVGTVDYDLSEKVLKNKKFARSLFVVADIKDGESFTDKNIRSIRPGYGVSPKFINQFIGKKANKDIKRGTPLSFDMI